MSNKKFLIKKLLDYPEISNYEYISLIDKQNKLFKNEIDNNELNFINNRINLYNEKQMIINLLKCPST